MTFHPCPLSRHWPQTQTAVSMPRRDPLKVVDDKLETADLSLAKELLLPWFWNAWELMEPNRKTPCSACKKHDALPLLSSNRIACLDYKMKQIMSEEKKKYKPHFRDFVQDHFRWAIRIDEFFTSCMVIVVTIPHHIVTVGTFMHVTTNACLDLPI